jgi:hypothetical protein
VGIDSWERSCEGEKGGLCVEGRVRPLFLFFWQRVSELLGSRRRKGFGSGGRWLGVKEIDLGFLSFFLLSKLPPFFVWVVDLYL